ncbi:MAG: thiamine pyrophosphate-binding protein [Nitrospira sp.]|nr:thiamine pyrophosphate-binding protein [Nitrospira sp.]MDH4252714.1 thiamine pyrophosphate-binding protein [Nitrospira sp.]MDH4344088.1 thiamine pyrophosphate-binding protein [Nitrospira sp.]
MADVHGRLTGEAGVCLSALWPGANNLLTGVVDAYLDHAPLVATPNRPLSVGAAKNHPPCDFGGLHPFPLSLKQHRVQTAPRSAMKRH